MMQNINTRSLKNVLRKIYSVITLKSSDYYKMRDEFLKENSEEGPV